MAGTVTNWTIFMGLMCLWASWTHGLPMALSSWISCGMSVLWPAARELTPTICTSASMACWAASFGVCMEQWEMLAITDITLDLTWFSSGKGCYHYSDYSATTAQHLCVYQHTLFVCLYQQPLEFLLPSSEHEFFHLSLLMGTQIK